MMSLQSPMHSSQMYTVGPAISFLTSFWALPQNEQVRDAPSRFSIGIGRRSAYRGAGVGTSRPVPEPVQPPGWPALPDVRWLPIHTSAVSSHAQGEPPRLLLVVRLLLRGDQHLVDDPVLLGLRRRHEVVALGVVLDLVRRLPGVLRVQLVERVARLQDLPGVDVDVRR